MNKHDKKIGNVTVHAGTDYGGAAQSSISYYHNSGHREEKSFDRSLIFSPEILGRPEVQWVGKGDGSYIVVNCPQLRESARKLMIGHKHNSRFNHLYKELFDSLQDSKFDKGIVRFYITATGVVPRQKRELGNFLKLEAEGYEFTLPYSFLDDCKPAFLPPLPRRKFSSR